MTEPDENLLDSIERYGRFVVEFSAESDRGCAVLVLCVLEDALHGLFRALIVDPAAKFARLAPPGGLAVAIENAELLGLISATEAQCFRLLAKVRNDFAHGALENLTFDTAQIKSKIDNLPVPLASWSTVMKGTARERFLIVASALNAMMLFRRAQVARVSAALSPFDR